MLRVCVLPPFKHLACPTVGHWESGRISICSHAPAEAVDLRSVHDPEVSLFFFLRSEILLYSCIARPLGFKLDKNMKSTPGKSSGVPSTCVVGVPGPACWTII